MLSSGSCWSMQHDINRISWLPKPIVLGLLVRTDIESMCTRADIVLLPYLHAELRH
jgi:hypothetical protein